MKSYDATILGTCLFYAALGGIGTALAAYLVFSQKNPKNIESKVISENSITYSVKSDVKNGHPEHYFDIEGKKYIIGIDKNGHQTLTLYENTNLMSYDNNGHTNTPKVAEDNPKLKMTWQNVYDDDCLKNMHGIEKLRSK